MDISKLKPTKISSFAREKIILDFFPDVASEIEIFSNEDNFNDKIAPLHAGALCLYATTLITKVHETAPLDLEPHYKEREESLKKLIKSNPKYVSLSETEVETFAKNLIIKDIRNSFAHGNFEISYDIYSKKLFFVLKPQRKDFICNEPIVISKKALFDLNVKFLNNKHLNSALLANMMLQNDYNFNINGTIKSFMLPWQLLKIADYYIGKNKSNHKDNVLFNDKLYYLIDYAMLASKITYEQNDYYNLFGRNSNIFNAISFIRNSIAHDNFEFIDNAHKVNYSDKDRTLSETIGESAVKLLVVDSQKQILCNLKSQHSNESIASLAEKFTEIFDFFFGGKYKLEDIVNVISETEKEQNEKE